MDDNINLRPKQAEMESQGLKNPPITQPPPQPQLFVGDLDTQVTESQLYQHLIRFGSINYIRIIRSFKVPSSLNYALVSFTSPESAVKAQNELDGEVINGRHIRVVKFTQERLQDANIFVKNIPESVSAKEFKDYFSVFGNIVSSKVVYDDQGRPLRYGFIQFDKKESAAQAIQSKNGSTWLGQLISVSKFLPVNQRVDNSTNKNLYVRGFPQSYSEGDLLNKFSQFGDVISVAIMFSKSGLPFGFICFGSERAAEAALSLNNSDEDGFSWYVVPHMKKTYRLALLREKYSKQVELWKRVNLYIRNLPLGIDEEKLEKLCAQYGEITSVKICKSENIKFEAPKYDANGNVINQSVTYTYDASGSRVPSSITKEMTSRGVAFVCFKTEQALNNAIRGLQTQTIEGNKLIVAKWKPREELKKIILQSKIKKQMKYMWPFGPHQGMQMGRGNFFRPQVPQNQMPRARGIPGPHMGPPPQMNYPMPPRPIHNMVPHPPMIHQIQPMQPLPQPPQQVQMPKPPIPDLTKVDPSQHKQILGEALYHIVITFSNQNIAGKITGMLLEMTNDEIITLLSNPLELRVKVNEAIAVLRAAWASNPEQLKLLSISNK
ncbi:unnamed protein product [Blepharisma stoltei]|uniref:Polyadenylate-binding protein n=1 Tax=Blepharisma stoltei TaxID=1481888 RepID=A0AAU9K227_9CILI|nr:unnamed protein product [Blepharisma stoltei]